MAIPVRQGRAGAKRLASALAPCKARAPAGVASRARTHEAERAQAQARSRFSLAAAWEDYDDDGDPDLFVANDFGAKNLYRNDGGRFVDVTTSAGITGHGMGLSATWWPRHKPRDRACAR